MSNYWSQYWRQGHLTSFGEDIKDNYIGTLKDVWQDVFDTLQATDKVIDIATGNGALVKLIYDGRNESEFPFVDAIDLADIQITDELKQQSNKTEFYSRVNCEKLPFENESTNLIISQFGIEYSNLERSIAEVARVLTTNGTAQFVCHHKESIIVKPNLNILRKSLDLKSKNGGVAIIKKLLNEIQKHGKGSATAERQRNKLNKYMEMHIKSDEGSFMATNFHLMVRAVMANLAIPTNYEHIIQSFEKELVGSIERLSDLGNAALERTFEQKLVKYCEKHTLNLKEFVPVVNDKNEVLAWKINLKKY